MMTGKFVIRSIGVLAGMAVIGAGWDAEAGWRRHHHRRAACCEPVCCEPVTVYEPACCEPAPEPACCPPVRETVCCETVIVAPAMPCCTTSIVVAEKSLPSEQASVLKTEPGQQASAVRGTTMKAASLKR
jgi:hypothetical protein